MNAAVVTVGDELLSGETENTNASWLGRQLAARGVDVHRAVTVPDVVADIETVTRRLADRYDAVVVTGGVGPTHDDVTLDGVAAAFDRDLVEHPDAIAWFEDHESYARDDLTTGTTHLPEGARMLPNDVGVAPGAVLESGDGTGRTYVFPGVPGEMKAMFERVADEFAGERRHTKVVHSEKPESALVEHFDDVRERFDVKVGSYPGDGVRIRVQSTDASEAAAAADWLRERV